MPPIQLTADEGFLNSWNWPRDWALEFRKHLHNIEKATQENWHTEYMRNRRTELNTIGTSCVSEGSALAITAGNSMVVDAKQKPEHWNRSWEWSHRDKSPDTQRIQIGQGTRNLDGTIKTTPPRILTDYACWTQTNLGSAPDVHSVSVNTKIVNTDDFQTKLKSDLNRPLSRCGVSLHRLFHTSGLKTCLASWLPVQVQWSLKTSLNLIIDEIWRSPSAWTRRKAPGQTYQVWLLGASSHHWDHLATQRVCGKLDRIVWTPCFSGTQKSSVSDLGPNTKSSVAYECCEREMCSARSVFCSHTPSAT